MQAAQFYVDPVNGSPTGDGSASRPWRTIQEVFDARLVESQQWDKLPYAEQRKLVPRNAGAPIRAGDTIRLRSGYHGDLLVDGYYNPGNITLVADEGHTPRLSGLHIRSSAHWTIRGLTVSAEFSKTYERHTLVFLENHNWRGPVQDIVVEQCSLCSVADASAWTAQDWDGLSCNGIEAGGTRITIRDNRLLNVNFGISVAATHSLVSGNVVENFAGDGLRGLGSYGTFEYNTVKNRYSVNANHPDGFQSWSRGPGGVGTGEIVGVVLRGNTIINYVDPNQPFRGTLQGIGCFDGTFVDWVFENNVVITDHSHGLTLLGARNCLVINNTVIDRNHTPPGPPWICIGKHKNGTPPVDCVVRNNLTMALNNAPRVLQENNLKILSLAAAATLFVDLDHFDLHLLPGAQAIDAGSSVNAPKLDRDRIPRPQGKGIDIGAYEWHPQDVLPAREDGGSP
jgi:hypothetical protein